MRVREAMVNHFKGHLLYECYDLIMWWLSYLDQVLNGDDKE